MNAYELADKLNEWYNFSHENMCNEAAQMLRQQADRIAELEKLLEHSVGSDCREMRYIQEIENKDARIAELEKELKRTKFAWNLAENEIERLAPQTKPLSDEEIAKEWSKFYPDVFHTHLIDFVRAIEERHGIK